MRRIPLVAFPIFMYLIAVAVVSAADPSAAANPAPPSETAALLFGLPVSLWEKIIVALVSAILSFLGAMQLDRFKKKREPRKQISYEKMLHRGIVSVDEEIRRKTQVLYDKKELREPYRLSFNFENSGNSLIKSQNIRFKFPSECNIVDTYLAPVPEPEIGFEEIIDSSLGLNEKKFKISHFEVGQSVNFRFILSGSLEKDVEIHPFNEEGNVTLIEHSAVQALTEKDKLSKFLWLLFLLWVLPQVFYIIPLGDISELGAGLQRLGIIIYLLPLLKPVAWLVAHKFMTLGTFQQQGTTVAVQDVDPGATVNILFDRH